MLYISQTGEGPSRVGVFSVIAPCESSLRALDCSVTGQTECKTLNSQSRLHNEYHHFPYFLISAFHNSRNPSLIEHCFKSPKIHPNMYIVTWVTQIKYLVIFAADYMMPGARLSTANNT